MGSKVPGGFTDDLTFAGMLPGGHCELVAPLDVSRARELPGVKAVLVAEDIPGERNHGLVVHDWPVLVGIGERIRTVGDALAIVAAETRELATRALAMIETELEALPVVSDPGRPSAGARCNGGILKHQGPHAGDVEAAAPV
jgi:xanthine dehydrogenase molybdenum-binding subunit